MSLHDAVLKALHRRQGDQRLGVCLRGRYVSTVLGEYDGKELGLRQTGRMLHLLGPCQRFLLAQLASLAHLCLDKMKPGEALERLAALPRLPHLLTQRGRRAPAPI